MDFEKFEKASKYTPDMSFKRDRYTVENSTLPKGQVVFAGDSLTELFHPEKRLKKHFKIKGLEVYNRGICGDTSNRLLERVRENICSLSPSILFLLIGTNDLGRGADPQYVADNIRQIILTVRQNCENVRIITELVYPVNNDIYSNPAHIRKPEDIRTLNKMITIMSEKENFGIFDLSSVLCEKNGILKADLTTDGLHLNDRGYNLIAKKIASKY